MADLRECLKSLRSDASLRCRSVPCTEGYAYSMTFLASQISSKRGDR
ncbi:MAG: hypothetical protein HXY43_13955 [Fischerella sp.]|nr:hypothetical protein [Fischerella sp.]NWF60328.1 hypothetical protein [Fischerella sp.]